MAQLWQDCIYPSGVRPKIGSPVGHWDFRDLSCEKLHLFVPSSSELQLLLCTARHLPDDTMFLGGKQKV